MPESTSRKSSSCSFFTALFSVLAPVLAAILLYQLDSFDPAPLPVHELTQSQPLKALMKNDHLLQGSEFVGQGKLLAPEDITYDSKSGLIYTTCVDGWIKRVTVSDSVAESVVENWINTGGRPLGLVLGHSNEVIVADAYKGLLKINSDGEVELLTDEAEGLKFKLADGVDIAEDGTIYFTDASYKYDVHEYMWDALEGRPYGRLLSYDPRTKATVVLVRDLYFPNGVTVSPDQNYVVFCETPRSRCRKYYTQGEKKGSVEKFVERLPGAPDNIHYNGDGSYWIALTTEISAFWDLASKYPAIRKVLAIMTRYLGRLNKGQNGGIFVVDLEGKPIAHYYDLGLSMISSGIKIGKHLYCGSVRDPFILRLDLDKHPARATT